VVGAVDTPTRGETGGMITLGRVSVSVGVVGVVGPWVGEEAGRGATKSPGTRQSPRNAGAEEDAEAEAGNSRRRPPPVRVTPQSTAQSATSPSNTPRSTRAKGRVDVPQDTKPEEPQAAPAGSAPAHQPTADGDEAEAKAEAKVEAKEEEEDEDDEVKEEAKDEGNEEAQEEDKEEGLAQTRTSPRVRASTPNPEAAAGAEGAARGESAADDDEGELDDEAFARALQREFMGLRTSRHGGEEPAAGAAPLEGAAKRPSRGEEGGSGQPAVNGHRSKRQSLAIAV